MSTYYLLESAVAERPTIQVMELFSIQPGTRETADFLIQHRLTGGKVITDCVWRKSGNSLEREAQESAEAIGSMRGVDRAVRLNLYHLFTEFTGKDPSIWGILRGVRPTKIVHTLQRTGKSDEQIVQVLIKRYGVACESAELVTQIARRQQPILAQNKPEKISLYVGIPFCPSRCFYCSFPGGILPQQDGIDRFMTALHQDILAAAELIERHRLSVDTIYVGGGTPTSLPASDLEKLIFWLESAFLAGEPKEFTLEAGRPDSVTAEKLDVIHHSQVTRLSVNPQSMQQKTLKRIGRNHTIQAIIDIFMKFRKTGRQINMDVIAGLPGETLADMQDTLRQIADLAPDNLTVHTLSIKRGSALQESLTEHDVGLYRDLPDSAEVKRMLEAAAQTAKTMGLVPYYLYRQQKMTGHLHNIGYARPDAICRYNIQMMEGQQTIIGIGPGAATKAVAHGSFRLASCYQAKDVLTYERDLERYLTRRQGLLDDLYAGKLFTEAKGDQLC